MAIDSARKRQNTLSVTRPYMRGHYPSDNDEVWRASIGSSYGSVLVEIFGNINSPRARQSVLGVTRPYMRGHYPGTNTAAWRASVGNSYRGNDAISVEIPNISGIGVTLEDTKLHFVFE